MVVVKLEAQIKNNNKAPWHMWVIGIIAFLWNSMGVVDFVMTQTKNVDYLSSFSAEQLAYFYSFPSWVIVAWAVGVFGGAIGSLFMLMRNALAVYVYLASLLAVFVTNVHNYLLSDGMHIMGDAFSLIFATLIFCIALGLYLYSLGLKKARIL